MKSVKCIIFLVGICLVNYIGGVPQDGRNLFITHTVFFAPILVEFYILLSIKSYLKWVIRILWVAGIFVIIANILGIAGVISISEIEKGSYYVAFNADYLPIIPYEVSLPSYLVIIGIVYTVVFVGTITLDYTLTLDKKLQTKAMRKAKKERGKELTSHVHSR